MCCVRCGHDVSDGGRFCPACGTTLDEAETPIAQVDPMIGRIIEGKYRIDAKLGSGGMGTVYRASRLLIGDTVAIKILHGGQSPNPEAVERFRREAQSAA